jgi:DNA polymerase I
LPRTKGGGPSLGGQGLIEAAKDRSEEAKELAAAIAAIGGLRPLAQSALDAVQPDGKVHADIHTLQRSGRKSTQNPGLTTWSERDEKARVEKSYFIPNADNEVIVEFDYSQADARIVAAYSGDTEFAKRFAPGVDSHLLTAHIVWGEDVVGHDKHDPVTSAYRQSAKQQNHAYAYNAGPETLSKQAKVPIETSTLFVNQMRSAYRLVEKWKSRVIKAARRYGFVTGSWGRRMLVQDRREFTQAPALYGQNGTREIVVGGLIRLARRDIRLIKMLVAQVHDALVFSIPAAEADDLIKVIRECMETTWQPFDGSGQPVHFPVDNGPAAPDWQAAGH